MHFLKVTILTLILRRWHSSQLTFRCVFPDKNTFNPPFAFGVAGLDVEDDLPLSVSGAIGLRDEDPSFFSGEGAELVGWLYASDAWSDCPNDRSSMLGAGDGRSGESEATET